jgi:hypothetical protein
MPLIDLKTIPIAGAAPKRRTKSRAGPLKVDFDATIRHLASLIDPGAFAADIGPSREMLEADLAHAQQEISDLHDEIDWLSATPTDPIGEYQRIMAEARQQDRNVPLQRKRMTRHQRLLDIAERRKVAIAKAKLIFQECKKVLGRRNTLVVIKGAHGTRFIHQKGGF